MKKIIYVILLIPLILLVVVIIFNLLNNRILLNNFKNENIEIFIPSGMANKYEDVLSMSFDDRRIWIYHLNKKEINLIDEDLNSGSWKTLEDNFEREAKFYFTVGLDDYWPKNLSNTVYYCLYDTQLNRFISSGSEGALLGWHRLLFLYDAVNHNYYCVSMSI